MIHGSLAGFVFVSLLIRGSLILSFNLGRPG
jgi:hypothetical protein